MHAKLFRTSPIHFETLQDLHAFVESIRGIHVDPMDFMDDHYMDEDQDEGLATVGTPLKLQICETDCTLVIYGAGGLTYYDAHKLADVEAPKTYGDLMKDVFDYKFYRRHPGAVIIMELRSLESGTTTEIIRLKEYHSKDEYEKRLEKTMKEMKAAKLNIDAATKNFNSSKDENRKILSILTELEEDAELDAAF